jgi:hypothetical protein
MGLVLSPFGSKRLVTNAIAVWSSPQIIAVITISGFSLLAFLVYGKNGLVCSNRYILTKVQNSTSAMTATPIRPT